MIKVSQFVSNSQLCHQVTKSLKALNVSVSVLIVVIVVIEVIVVIVGIVVIVVFIVVIVVWNQKSVTHSLNQWSVKRSSI